MKKFQKVFNIISSLLTITAVIFTMSFISQKINDIRSQKRIIKTNTNYVMADPPEKKRYEEIIAEKEEKIPANTANESSVTANPAETSRKSVKDYNVLISDIVKDFNITKLEFNKKTADYRIHNGIDIRYKDAIPALMNGVIKINDSLDENICDVTIQNESGEAAIYKGIILNENIKDASEVKIGDLIGFSSEKRDYVFHLGILKEGKFINPTEIFK